MTADIREEPPHLGPYKPTLIIHGGAGAISRSNLPPELHKEYNDSLTSYLVSTKHLLDDGGSALDAACHAVTLLEDDPLFNCGRGAVFTRDGKNEMEASVMVASAAGSGPPCGNIKRAGAVSMIRNTRHPILLAKAVLLDADDEDGMGGTSTMHSHVSGRTVEEWGWAEKHLEKKPDDWFWTKKRWDEHRRGLEETGKGQRTECCMSSDHPSPPINQHFLDASVEETPLPSQGTVGAVCFDSWGNIAVATSTGGLTNKAPGRIGDTPTVGAGFWAESWDKTQHSAMPNTNSSGTSPLSQGLSWLQGVSTQASRVLGDCLPSPLTSEYHSLDANSTDDSFLSKRTVVAMSGTGNGDSFLRISAVRSAAAISRFSFPRLGLQNAVTGIAGPGGELQKSAGERWMHTGEGQGGIIGIELSHGRVPHVVYDFNCGGMWRAYYAWDQDNEKEVPRVRVFRD